MRTDAIPDLIAFGMTEREAKLYVAMMAKPEWKASELHRITGVPRTETHRTLELMVTRQYCLKRSEGKFNFYRAISPDIIREILVRRWEEELSGKLVRVDNTMELLSKEFNDKSKVDKTLDFIEIVQTPHRIHRRFVELLQSAKHEVLGLDRSPYSFVGTESSSDDKHEQNDANVVACERGVIIKTIIMYEKDIWDVFEGVIESNIGDEVEEIKITDYLPIKLHVFDRKTTIMGVESAINAEQRVMNEIIIHDPGISRLCADVFDLYWKNALPYDEWKDQHRETK